LHPLQQAFVEEGAVQCGLHTRNVAAAKALLDENPSPTEAEIRAAIAGNFCAVHRLRPDRSGDKECSGCLSSPPLTAATGKGPGSKWKRQKLVTRVDALERLRERRYSVDVKLVGMLYGRRFCFPYAHACIV
jgi:xanthine dehydrogenase iron-sulfur cluster and FAD-binding subunit A